MKKNESKIIKFYKSKNGKATLFFGFYLIFFLVLAFFVRNMQRVRPIENDDNLSNTEVINKNYSITSLTDTNYSYLFNIKDNGQIISFKGYKNNPDYLEYENYYFFDLYNLNQLIKKSKFIKRDGNVLEYSLPNSVLNDLFEKDKPDGENTISVYVDEKGNVNKIILDLSNYWDKKEYIMDLDYRVGEENEQNSIS